MSVVQSVPSIQEALGSILDIRKNIQEEILKRIVILWLN